MNDVVDPTLETTELDLPVGNEPDDTQPASREPSQEPAAAPLEKKSVDVEAALAELAGTVNRIAAPREPAAPPPTAAEIADFWKVYDPEASDKEFFKKWFRLNPDATPEEVQQAKEMFAGVQRGLMLQSVTATRNYIAQARREIDAELGPLREFVASQQREATRGRFFEGYPGLSDKRFNKILDATARSLDNKVFANEEEYFKALAEGAAGSIREILPEFDLGAKPTTQKPGQPPKLPRSSVGGGGGAGKGAHDVLQPTGRKNDIDSLEDNAE